MYCKKCGKEIDDNSEFCKYCGCHVNDNKGSGVIGIPTIWLMLYFTGLAILLFLAIAIDGKDWTDWLLPIFLFYIILPMLVYCYFGLKKAGYLKYKNKRNAEQGASSQGPWPLLIFAHMYGKMQIKQTTYPDGTVGRKCIFTNNKGKVTEVAFGEDVASMNAADISANKDSLIIEKDIMGRLSLTMKDKPF